MSWMSRYKNWMRLLVFVLVLIAVLGPWAYEGDGVPPVEFCSPPYLLLENGRCVGRMSGAYIISYLMLFAPSLVSQLISGELVLSERGRELLVVLPPLLLVVLPVTSALLRVRSANSRSFHLFSMISWGLAVGLGLLIAAFAEVFHPDHLWGLWLYIVMAGAILIWELRTYIGRMRERPATA